MSEDYHGAISKANLTQTCFTGHISTGTSAMDIK